MKGIRKLFYGFVLMALFSVGFKIEAKAAMSVTLQGPTDSDWDISSDSYALQGKLNYTFPTNPDTEGFPALPGTEGQFNSNNYLLTIRQTGTDPVGTNWYVSLRTRKVSGEPEYYVGTGDTVGHAENNASKITASGSTALVVKATKSQVLTAFGERAAGPKTYTLHLLQSDGTALPGGAVVTDTYNVSMFRIDTDKSPATVTDSVVTLSKTPNYTFFLPGEKVQVVANKQTASIPYRFVEWYLGADPHISDASAGSTNPPTINVKMSASSPANSTVTARYSDFSVTLPITTSDTKKAGDQIVKDFTFSGTTPYKGQDVSKVLLGTAEVTDGWGFDPTTASSGTFTFTVPAQATNGTKTLTFVMSDGNTFTREFTYSDTSTVTIKSDGVAVTVGKNANLSQFLTDGATRNGTVTITGDADDYADVSPSSGSNAVGTFKIVGVTAMKESKKNKISITPTGGTAVEGRVTVYPKVTIATNSSASSDSLNSGTSSSSKETPLKVTVPAYVYYDNTGYKVSKAQIHFEGSDGTKTRSLDAPDSVSGTSWTVSVDSMKLSSILKDVCDGSSDEVKIKVYPYKGDDPDKTEGIGASTEIKAYKISLDGSGGAKYTINGEDVGDYFYAVKGTRYTIKATPKVAGDKFKNWDNNAFPSESGGDFTASESRTFKANYDSGSSSSSSSGRSTATNGESTGSGDYDDVPKTGESKTDIWILWSVLMISILGAGFMIWKRFGLARAIAEAEEQVAVAEHEEQVKAEKKAKKDKLDMLKDLRNL